jgi:hypothetical protein
MSSFQSKNLYEYILIVSLNLSQIWNCFLNYFIFLRVQIEAVATKEELEHLAMLCRSEADAMGRITASILRLLKLEKSLGQGTIEQLRNLGIDSPLVFLITFLYDGVTS